MTYPGAASYATPQQPQPMAVRKRPHSVLNFLIINHNHLPRQARDRRLETETSASSNRFPSSGGGAADDGGGAADGSDADSHCHSDANADADAAAATEAGACRVRAARSIGSWRARYIRSRSSRLCAELDQRTHLSMYARVHALLTEAAAAGSSGSGTRSSSSNKCVGRDPFTSEPTPERKGKERKGKERKGMHVESRRTRTAAAHCALRTAHCYCALLLRTAHCDIAARSSYYLPEAVPVPHAAAARLLSRDNLQPHWRSHRRHCPSSSSSCPSFCSCCSFRPAALLLLGEQRPVHLRDAERHNVPPAAAAAAAFYCWNFWAAAAAGIGRRRGLVCDEHRPAVWKDGEAPRATATTLVPASRTGLQRRATTAVTSATTIATVGVGVCSSSSSYSCCFVKVE